MQEPIAPLNHLPLLHFYPGGIQQELVVSSYAAKVREFWQSEYLVHFIPSNWDGLIVQPIDFKQFK